jgi:enoyl-CoA hydratase/carnithine racemase
VNKELLIERDGAIVTVTFNRPEARNAMTWGMYQGLYEACEEVDRDESVRVMILKGACGKAFVAGTDISQFTEFKGGDDGIKYERDGDKRSGRIARVTKPVIAQIQGYAVGGGFAITAGADIRIATPDAKFGVPTAKTLGNCLSMKNYAMFATLIGPSRVKELLFTARLMTADEALSAGYVHEIVSHEQIESRVKELADKIANHAPLTLWATKEALRRLQDAGTLPADDDIVRKVYGSADFKEGVSAFVEKRPPRWTGK